MTMFRGLILSSIFKRQLHVISRSNSKIKPASATPLNLKQYNLPLSDITLPSMYVPLLFFYPNNNSNSSNSPRANTPTTIANQLKKSLSETLSKCYPFAGRLESRSHVDCSDQGADFVEARVGCKLSEILGKADQVNRSEFSAHLFPPGSIWNNVQNQDSSLARVQLNYFDCGGIAIAASISHRLGDAATICSFLCYWANMSRHSGDHQKLLHLCPHYELQPEPCMNISHIPEIVYPEKYWITKDIVFHNRNIAELKANVELECKQDGAVQDKKYTRNELLTAFLYRCVVSAAATAPSNSGAYAASALCQSVNIRRMMDPPLPETTVGNFVAPLLIVATSESEIKVTSLVKRMRERKMQLREIKLSNGFESIPSVKLDSGKNNHRFIYISSMCNYPIYKEMDFGWGRPSEVTLVDAPIADCISLMDTASGDGIKACVSLEEKDMKRFLNNQELLTYASNLQ